MKNVRIREIYRYITGFILKKNLFDGNRVDTKYVNNTIKTRGPEGLSEKAEYSSP